MGTVKPCLSGPKRPQDRILLEDMPENFHGIMKSTYAKRTGAGSTGMEAGYDYNRWMDEGGYSTRMRTHIGHSAEDYKGGVKDKIKNKIPARSLNHGSIAIAAITSCTNTSNPSVMIAAGLLAKNAVERGLKVNPCVKTSLAPGSRVVTDYFTMSGLLPYLEALGFHVVGYGCTTCIGNSGPLSEDVAEKVRGKDLTVAAVLSGNRNFEGRINPLVKANYLASPPLVIAYAIAGTVDIDLTNEPLGFDPNGIPVYLKDIWPRHDEIQQIIARSLKSDMFERQYSKVLEGAELWKDLDVPKGTLYEWDSESTYIQEPPFFKDFPLAPPKIQDIKNARVLALLGDSITTDHISPAGAFADDDPAGKYLIARGLDVAEFNSYGSRRGNHEVMMRGTFANVRLRNRLVPEREGGWTLYHPTGNEMTIYDAAMNYMENDVSLIVIAGHEYGTGSSRDWAAKGTLLLGVKAVIAESFERIHRSNLVGLGVLPLQFKEGENAENLGLKGDEYYDILGIADVKPKDELKVVARGENGEENTFNVIVRLDSPVDVKYYRNGGILHTFLRDMVNGK
ncbi:MAG: aconitate hydratase AcnA, partial [Methanosarcinales archaeon]|nr:aconitate hydratase AcnA [Methanosarcinales archaeon]